MEKYKLWKIGDKVETNIGLVEITGYEKMSMPDEEPPVYLPITEKDGDTYLVNESGTAIKLIDNKSFLELFKDGCEDIPPVQ